MDNESLLPNERGSNVFEIPRDEEAAKEEVKEKGAVTAAAPLIDDILKAFDDEIARAKTIDGLSADVGYSLEGQIHAKKLYQGFLQEGRQHIEALKERHITGQ